MDAAQDGCVKVLILPIAIFRRLGFFEANDGRARLIPAFLEWLLPLLVQVLVAGALHHPPLLTSQNMTSTTKSWVDQ